MIVNDLHEESWGRVLWGQRAGAEKGSVGVLFVRMAPSRSFSYLLDPVEAPLWESEGPPN